MKKSITLLIFPLIAVFLFALIMIGNLLDNTSKNKVSILLNGGGSASINYASHNRQLKKWREKLTGSGFDSVILSGAGGGKIDTAFLEDKEKRKVSSVFYQNDLDYLLERKVKYKSVDFEGAVGEASLDNLVKAIELVPDSKDLFLYISDHGRKGEESDPVGNSIDLWGESVNVAELSEHLNMRSGKTKLLMTQCFSGAFARMSYVTRDNAGDFNPTKPKEGLCGYFSTVPTEMAYGCYPEEVSDASKEFGYGFEMLEQVKQGRSLSKAHDFVSRNSSVPDIPVTSLDMYIADLGFNLNYYGLNWEMIEKDFRAAESNEYLTELINFREDLTKRFELFSFLKLDNHERLSEALLDLIADSEMASEKARLWEERLLLYSASVMKRIDPEIEKSKDLIEFRENVFDAAKELSSLEAKIIEGPYLESRLRLYNEKVTFLEENYVETLKKGMDSVLKLVPNNKLWLANNLRKKLEQAMELYYKTALKKAIYYRYLVKMRTMMAQYWAAQNQDHEFSKGINIVKACLLNGDSLVKKQGERKLLNDKGKDNKNFALDKEILELNRSLRVSVLGVETDISTINGKEYLEVKRLEDDGPAIKAGIKVGDLLSGIDNVELDPEDIPLRIMLHPEDKELIINLIREEKSVAVKALLVSDGNLSPSLSSEKQREGDFDPTRYKDIEGNKISVSGENYVIYFFATWCGPCKDSEEDFKAWLLANDLGPENVIAVSNENEETLNKYIRNEGFTYSVVASSEAEKIFSFFNPENAIPTWLLISKGKVVARKEGYIKNTGFQIRGVK